MLLLVTYRAFTGAGPDASHCADRCPAVSSSSRRACSLYTVVGFWVLKEEFVPEATPADMIGEFFSRLVFQPSGNIEPQTRAADWFVTSIGAVWIVTIIVTAVGLIYPEPAPAAGPRARTSGCATLLSKYPSSSIEWMLTWKGNTIWFSADGRDGDRLPHRRLGRAVPGRSGRPARTGARGALKEFDDYCFRHGWIPCLFAAGHRRRPSWHRTSAGRPCRSPRTASSTLEHLEFKGKQWQDIRTAINKAGKQDVRLEVTKWADAKPVVHRSADG